MGRFIHFLSQSLAFTMSNNRDKWLATKAMLETHKEIIATAMISDQFRENLPIKWVHTSGCYWLHRVTYRFWDVGRSVVRENLCMRKMSLHDRTTLTLPSSTIKTPLRSMWNELCWKSRLTGDRPQRRDQKLVTEIMSSEPCINHVAWYTVYPGTKWS